VIRSLKYEVTFPSTGKTLSNELTFDLGMTAIVGANGRGKTLIVEMIRYALYGSKALRGQASDYSNLKVELYWDTLFVLRNGTRAVLYRDGIEIAVGTKAVNAKIVEILGFPLDVFDVACSVNQGNIAALSSMLPSERKQMVDNVSGMTFLVELGKWANDQAKDEGTRAEALEGVLVKPVEPSRPEGYRISHLIEKHVNNLEALVHEMSQLQGWLSVPRSPPVEPVRPAFTESLDELEALVSARAAVVAERAAVEASLKRLPPAPKVVLPEDAEAQLDAWDRWQERDTFLRRNPVALCSQKDIEDSETNLKIDKRDSLKRDIEAHFKGCPNCGFDLSGSHVDEMRKELELLGPLPTTKSGSELTRSQIDENVRRIENWNTLSQDPVWLALDEGPFRLTSPPFTRKDIDNARFEKERAELTTKLASFVIPVDRSPDLRALHIYQIAQETYAQATEAYAQYLIERATKEQRLEELKPLTSNLPTLKVELELARAYERDLANYTKAKALYDTKLAEVTALRSSEANWRKVKAALDELRAKVKSYLVPALSRVASSLLWKMTGGKRTEVLVNDDFDLFVDNQPVRTLSGAEKAIANIALRIALGQILTCRAFPFLALDEFDEALDAEWSESTAEAIRSLTGSIAQIFVVSHKDPLADSYIRL